MGYLEVIDGRFAWPGSRALFEGISFRVPAGEHVALVGANGVGKTTILKCIAGEERLSSGRIKLEGRVGYMRQFVGSFGSEATVRDFFLSLSQPALRSAGRRLAHLEGIVRGAHGRVVQMRYADALSTWNEIGGYDAEVLWDTVTTEALGAGMATVAARPLTTLSGGEQKRLALEAFWRSDAEVLLLDEPDNFLDIPAKEWLERKMNEARKTILFVSHDRTILAKTAHAIVTLEGRDAWTHHGPYRGYARARADRLARIEEEQRRYREKHERIVEQIKEFKRRAAMNEKFASRARAAEKKLERFERAAAPRLSPEEQNIRMDLGGGRTGKLALKAQGLSFPQPVASTPSSGRRPGAARRSAGGPLVRPFTFEAYFGERIGVVGANGTGKSHFLKLLAGEHIRHEGVFRLGARVQPAHFSQLHDRPELAGKASLVSLLRAQGLELGHAMSGLKRYELSSAADLPFSLLSGGQQARFQILLMEIASPTMLLLDEPTDNLDIDSAEALEVALDRYQGTVIAVTHDRWFMRMLDRFLVFEADGSVRERSESPYLMRGA